MALSLANSKLQQPGPLSIQDSRAFTFSGPVAQTEELSVGDKQEIAYRFLKSLNLPSSALLKFASRLSSSAAPAPTGHDPIGQCFPAEVCIEIFSNLCLSDILNVSQVSKSWRQVAHDSSVWRELYLHQKKWDFRLPSTLNPDWRHLFRTKYSLEANWHKGRCVKKTLTYGHDDSVYTIQCDAKRRIIVSGSRDRTIKAWNMDSRTCIKTLRHHQGSILCLSIDLDRDLVVTGSSDTEVVVWNYSSGTIRSVFKGHTSSVFNVHIYKEYVVSCSKDSTIRVWSLATQELVRVLSGHTAAINAIQVADGRIVSASGDRTLKIWDLETGECLRTLVGHTHGVSCLAFDGELIVSGSSDQTIRIFDAQTGCWLNTIYNAHEDLVRTISLHGDVLVTGSYDKTIKVWKKRAGPTSRLQTAKSPALRRRSVDDSCSDTSSPPASPTSPLKRVSFLSQKPSVAYLNQSIPTGRQQTWEVMYVMRSQDWSPSFGRVYNVTCNSRYLVASSETSSIAFWDYGAMLPDINTFAQYI